MRISRTQWLIIATMGANTLLYLTCLILTPPSTFFAAHIIRFFACIIFSILVSLGINWARVLWAIFTGLSIFVNLCVLIIDFGIEGKYGQLNNHPDTSQITMALVLTIIHLPILIWTMWLLTNSENVSEFFYQKKHRNSN
jgi:hypothetical protein